MLNEKEIRAIRITNGIKQYDFAELIGTPIGTWSNIEIGRYPLHADVAIKAGAVLREMDCDFSVLKDKVQIEKLNEKHIHAKREQVDNVEIRVVSAETLQDKQEISHQQYKDNLFHQIAKEVAETLCKKNHDYGDSFHDQFKKFGDISSCIRLGDKLGRLETLATIGEDKAKVQESIDDIYLDIAGYAILSYASRIRLRNGGN